MIKKSLKTISVLKVFQCFLAFLCLSAPIIKTEAIFGWFEKKKKPVEDNNKKKKKPANQKKEKNKKKKTIKKKGSNKKAKTKLQKKISDKKPKAKLENGISAKTAAKTVNQQYHSMDTESVNAENIKEFAEKNGLTLDPRQTMPSYEACKSDLSTQMFGLVPSWFKVHSYYAGPVTQGPLITVSPIIGSEIKTIAQPLILALQDLLDKNEDPTKAGLVPESQRIAELHRKNLFDFLKKHLSDSKHSQAEYKKSISHFIELHKAYHGDSSTLDFLPSQYSQLLDICNNIKGISKKTNTFVHDQLNQIESILGLGQTTREPCLVQKVRYVRPKNPENQSTFDQNDKSVRNKIGIDNA